MSFPPYAPTSAYPMSSATITTMFGGLPWATAGSSVADTAATPTRLVAVSSDSIVVDLTRPLQQRTGGPATLRVVGSVCGTELTGYAIARPVGGGQQWVCLTGERTSP